MQEILRASLRRIDLKHSHDQRNTAVEKGASASEQRALVKLVEQLSVLEAAGNLIQSRGSSMLQSCDPMAPSHRIRYLEGRYNIETIHSPPSSLQIASQRYWAAEGVHFLCAESTREAGAFEHL